jgi:hypothetical protein
MVDAEGTSLSAERFEILRRDRCCFCERLAGTVQACYEMIRNAGKKEQIISAR